MKKSHSIIDNQIHTASAITTRSFLYFISKEMSLFINIEFISFKKTYDKVEMFLCDAFCPLGLHQTKMMFTLMWLIKTELIIKTCDEIFESQPICSCSLDTFRFQL